MLLVVLLCLSVSVCVLWVCWWLALMCSEEIWAFFAGSDFFRGTRVLSKLWHTHTLTALTKLCISLSVCHTLLLCGDWPLAQLLTHFPPSPSSTCSEHHHTHTHTIPIQPAIAQAHLTLVAFLINETRCGICRLTQSVKSLPELLTTS